MNILKYEVTWAAEFNQDLMWKAAEEEDYLKAHEYKARHEMWRRLEKNMMDSNLPKTTVESTLNLAEAHSLDNSHLDKEIEYSGRQVYFDAEHHAERRRELKVVIQKLKEPQ